MKRSAVLFTSLFVLATSNTLPFDGKVRYTQDGSYIAYMDPPFQSNHASFLEQFPDGGLGMAWFSGSAEGQSDVAIVYSWLASGSTQWSSAKVISQRNGYSNQNPVLFYDNTTDLLHCFHSQQQAKSGESNAQIWHLQSSDLGKTWSTAAPLFTENGSFCKNRIIPNLKNGLLFPIYNASDNTAMIAISQSRNNLGDSKSWTINPIKNSDHLVQPSLIRLPLSYPKIKAFFRDRRATAIYEATSTDDGATWETPYSFQLPNPNVAIQSNVLNLTEGPIILLFNDYNGKNNLGRTPMTMGFSYDDATTFPNIRNLQYHNDNETSLDINGPHVEYSYPSVLQTSDGWIHASYTYNRQTIKYMKFNYTWALVG